MAGTAQAARHCPAGHGHSTVAALGKLQTAAIVLRSGLALCRGNFSPVADSSKVSKIQAVKAISEVSGQEITRDFYSLPGPTEAVIKRNMKLRKILGMHIKMYPGASYFSRITKPVILGSTILRLTESGLNWGMAVVYAVGHEIENNVTSLQPVQKLDSP